MGSSHSIKWHSLILMRDLQKIKMAKKLKQTTKIIQTMICNGIKRTNSKMFKKNASDANAKMYKLSTLYFNVKNSKKKKLKITYNKKRKGQNQNVPNPKRQKLNE